MIILGIDLGTTNSACAIWKDGESVLIPNRLGSFLTPSVIGVDDSGEILVGEIARHRLISHPEKTTSLFKRYMGSDSQIRVGKKILTAPELSSLVLRSLKEDAETYTGQTITHAVISVPAYFNDIQRKATKLAGELAGLQVDRLINEPTAAAMMYGIHSSDNDNKFMILDMGGGTFDVSIIEYFDGVLEVHASSGDNNLGGEDFLNIIAEYYFKAIDVNSKSLKATELQHVFDELESAKRKLSFEHEVEISGLIKSQTKPWILTRKDFDRYVQPLLQRIQTPIERTLRDTKTSLDELGEVILVGGATRMHAFRSLVTKMFQRLPSGNIDPDLVVAMGAGIQAGLKQKDSDLDDIVLTDVSPYSLGTEIVNENDSSNKQGGLFLPIIERNSIVPTSIERTLCTVSDNQTTLLVNIFQGESRLVKNNIYLGELEVKLPNNKAGEETVDIRYSYDMNGILEVDVTVTSTGKKYNKTIINAPGSLSESEIEKSKKKLSALKFHPRETEENRALIARAERLFESSLGERRDELSQLLSSFDAVLEQQNLSEIKRAVKQVREILEELESENLFS